MFGSSCYEQLGETNTSVFRNGEYSLNICASVCVLHYLNYRMGWDALHIKRGQLKQIFHHA